MSYSPEEIMIKCNGFLVWLQWAGREPEIQVHNTWEGAVDSLAASYPPMQHPKGFWYVNMTVPGCVESAAYIFAVKPGDTVESVLSIAGL